ncbi:MAG TPA: LuxR family transcriptional regulator [Planctomycetaceae bacterium]|nr:LuxR family transcriptional regulator [Planctomycetaceae bacterium]
MARIAARFPEFPENVSPIPASLAGNSEERRVCGKIVDGVDSMDRRMVFLNGDVIVHASPEIWCETRLSAGDSARELVEDADWPRILQAMEAVRVDDSAPFLFRSRDTGSLWLGRFETLASRSPNNRRNRFPIVWHWQSVPKALESMSSRQRQVLIAIAAGLSVAEVASRLDIAQSTVRSYLGRCRSVLHCRNHSELVRMSHAHRTALQLLSGVPELVC